MKYQTSDCTSILSNVISDATGILMLESIIIISISIRRLVLWRVAVNEKDGPLELSSCKAAGPTNIAREAKRKKNYTHTPEMSDMW